MTHEAEHQAMRENPATVIGAMTDDMRELKGKVVKMERFMKLHLKYDPDKPLAQQ